jgi:hypothetical protein
VRDDLFQYGFGQAVPQVLSVADLDRAGLRAADRLANADPSRHTTCALGCTRSHACSTPTFRLARTSTRWPVSASIRWVA